MSEKLNQSDELTLWVGATRYYMGRRSYAVEDFCRLLINEWGNLDLTTKSIILRDVEETFVRDDKLRKEGDDKYLPLGNDCDRQSWEKVRNLWQNEKNLLTTK